MTATLVGPSDEMPMVADPPVRRHRRWRPSTGIELGIATLYLSFVVVIPLAAVRLAGHRPRLVGVLGRGHHPRGPRPRSS